MRGKRKGRKTYRFELGDGGCDPGGGEFRTEVIGC